MSESNLAATRLIDEQGRIVLPAEARRIMSWGDKTPVEIWVNPVEDEIIIKRHSMNCFCCGKTTELKEYRKLHICNDCKREITKL